MNSKSKNSASKHVVFLDGLEIRHGFALTQRGGVWRVDRGREIVNVWEDVCGCLPGTKSVKFDTQLNAKSRRKIKVLKK